MFATQFNTRRPLEPLQDYTEKQNVDASVVQFQETVEVITVVAQERILDRILENTDFVPPIKEAIAAVVQFGTNRGAECEYPRVSEESHARADRGRAHLPETGEHVLRCPSFCKSTLQNATLNNTLMTHVLEFPQEIVSECKTEQIVDVPPKWHQLQCQCAPSVHAVEVPVKRTETYPFRSPRNHGRATGTIGPCSEMLMVTGVGSSTSKTLGRPNRCIWTTRKK